VERLGRARDETTEVFAPRQVTVMEVGQVSVLGSRRLCWAL
jgi:hypothetical protein